MENAPTTTQEVTWGREVMASVVVFLVALPLCMGIAVASGVPPALGLLSGILGGLVVGLLAGSPLQVSGPAAGLAVLVWQLVEQYGLPALGVAVVCGGALQLIAGMAKVGRVFRAVSPAVIQGMLAGIGVLIFASQFHVMVDDAPRSTGWANLASIPESIAKGLFPVDGSTHHVAASIGVLSIVLIVTWERFRPKALHAVPGPLIAVLASASISQFVGLDIAHVVVPANMTENLNLPPPEAWGLIGDPKFLFEIFALALIASAETLLCATAVDQLHTGPRTDYDKELRAQGIGNLCAGALGALPITGVIVRSSANVEAGATTRWSAVMHGAWLLLLVLFAPFVLESIPTSALAAILVYTGYKLFNPKRILAFARFGRAELAIYITTVVCIVWLGLLWGVIIGLGLALLKLLFQISVLNTDLEHTDDELLVHIEGVASFVRLPTLDRALREAMEQGSEKVRLETNELLFLDDACYELFMGWKREMEALGRTVVADWDRLQWLTREVPLEIGRVKRRDRGRPQGRGPADEPHGDGDGVPGTSQRSALPAEG